MEAHRSYERFEQGHQLSAGEGGGTLSHHARNVAMAVAVMAAFLAVATFLANEAVKEVITGETHRANASALLESNRVKIDIAEGNSTMLRVLGAGGGAAEGAGTVAGAGAAAGGHQALRAAAAANRHEARVARQLRPTDARLAHQIQAHAHETDHANAQHIDYELAEVGLQIGIVLASVSIIARRRWLLGAAGAVATAGVVLLLVGLLLA